MTTREHLIALLQPHFDTFSACEQADRIIAETTAELASGQTRRYLLPDGTAVTLQRN